MLHICTDLSKNLPSGTPTIYNYNMNNLETKPKTLQFQVRSLRAVVELKQAEIASLQRARSEVITERELRTAAERDARNARQAAEELKERAAARQRDVDRLRDDNRRLRDAAARDRDHAARLAALNEELRYKLRQKSQVSLTIFWLSFKRGKGFGLVGSVVLHIKLFKTI